VHPGADTGRHSIGPLWTTVDKQAHLLPLRQHGSGCGAAANVGQTPPSLLALAALYFYSSVPIMTFASRLGMSQGCRMILPMHSLQRCPTGTHGPGQTCSPARWSGATRRVCESGQCRFLAFCTHFSFIPLPATESVLCHFVAFLAASGMSYGSMRSYLSAIQHLCIMSGFPDPSLPRFPRLCTLRREGATTPRAERLPITPARLRRVHGAWSRVPPSPDRCMLWAAFCLGFLGSLGASEFTCPSQSAFSHEMLEARDVLVDSLHICKCSRRPVLASHCTWVMSSARSHVGLLSYRPSNPGFLFLFLDGSTRDHSWAVATAFGLVQPQQWLNWASAIL
jgi:hypothetical protein